MLAKYKSTILHGLLLVLATVMLVTVCIRDIQPAEEVPQKIVFRGQYSYDGEKWQDVTEKTKISALDGDLWMRGSFELTGRQNEWIHFYLDHLEFCAYVDGQRVKCSDAWEWKNDPANCGRSWECISVEALTGENLVEFHLHNPHSFGNADAYMEFLDSFYLYSSDKLSGTVEPGSGMQRVIGLMMMGLSFGIIGIAISFNVMDEPLGKQLWAFGNLSLSVGMYILLSTKDVSLWSEPTVFNTYLQQMCIMVAAFELSVFLAGYLTCWRKQIAWAAVWLQGLFVAGAVSLCLLDMVLIYDVMGLWLLLVSLCFVALTVCTAVEWYHRGYHGSYALPSVLVLLFVSLAEAVNMYLLLWSEGSLLRLAFVVLFMVVIVKCLLILPQSYRQVIHSEGLENEMQNSRILMAMSQIRTHFVFNVLNAISGMCKYDPERADETVVRFSRFLRANIDIMENDQPVSFTHALNHVEDYVLLEQVRFGDKVEFETDITVDRFLIPPLIIQPLVENAIKHGLSTKTTGGTVKLSTSADENNIYVCVSDDGVGFDVSDETRDGAVGLNNVRFRLKHMMNGSLRVESMPGQGTKVTVIIPREEAEVCT